MRSAAALALIALVLARPAQAQGGDQDTTNYAEQAVQKSLQRGDTSITVDIVESRDLGRGRFMVFADRAVADSTRPHTLQGCLVSGPVARARAACLVLPTPHSASGFAAESVTVDDLARDGRQEVSLLVNYRGYSSPVDTNLDLHRLYVLTTTATPVLALSIETLRTNTDSGTSRAAEITWTDVNHDGHPDAVVRETSCDNTNQCSAMASHTYVWNRTTRRWVLRGG